MTETKNQPLKVFLCHADQDSKRVRKTYNRLKVDGVDPWFDKERLLPGQDWDFEIQTALRNADAIVVFLSQASITKEGYVQKEIKKALDFVLEKLDTSIYLIPARLEECTLPASLAKWQYVDLFKPDGYERLLQSLQVRAGQIEARPPRKSAPPVPYWKKNLWRVLIGILILIGILLTVLWIWPPLPPDPTPTTSPSLIPVTVTPSPPATFTPSPSPTATEMFTPTPTATASITPTVTPLPASITDADGVPMLLIPAGNFLMGFDQGTSDERPAHTVTLDNFYIDLFEVTNARYRACVGAGNCLEPGSASSKTYNAYFKSANFDNHPVVNVTWQMAQDYCLYRSARLPTEAEWEKAARGTDQRIYPWGDGANCSLANYCLQDTSPVGRYEEGRSFYELYDMAGNVAEWVADWYDKTYYSASLGPNPPGPLTGGQRVVRGGSFEDDSYTDLQAFHRVSFPPAVSKFYIGFRCAKTP